MFNVSPVSCQVNDVPDPDSPNHILSEGQTLQENNISKVLIDGMLKHPGDISGTVVGVQTFDPLMLICQ